MARKYTYKETTSGKNDSIVQCVHGIYTKRDRVLESKQCIWENESLGKYYILPIEAVLMLRYNH